MKKNSIKNTRINGEVRKEISRIISEELKDPRILGLTSVTAAEVTGDLKYAKIYISVLGSEEDKKKTIEGLNSAKPFIRTILARNVNLRNTPELTFVPDESIEYGVMMSKKIADLNIRYDEDDNDPDTDA